MTTSIKFPKLKLRRETKSIKVNMMEKTVGINWFGRDVINKKLIFFYFLRVRKEGNVTFCPGGPAWPSGPLWPMPGSP